MRCGRPLSLGPLVPWFAGSGGHHPSTSDAAVGGKDCHVAYALSKSRFARRQSEEGAMYETRTTAC